MSVILTIVIFLVAFGLLFGVVLKHYDQIESPIIVLATFLSFAIVITFIIILERSYTIYTGSGDIDMDSTGQIGDFIGGTVGTILTALSIILLYKTLQEQRKSFNKSQIESRFFELLKFHRDNVNEIEFEYYLSNDSSRLVKGRHFFVTANKQLEYAFEEFEYFFKSKKLGINDIYESKYLNELKQNKTLISRKFDDFSLLAKIDICYLILFLGVSKEGKCEILDFTKNKYNSLFMTDLLDYFRMKPSKHSIFYPLWKKLYDENSLIENIVPIQQDRNYKLRDKSIPTKSPHYYPDNYFKFYGGHQFRLGHYFRHLYQIVCFVHYNDKLTEKDKKNYIRILRGQLSDYEQKIFFVNSLSQLGRVWEISDSSGNYIKDEDHLITNYSITKSITKATLFDILKPNQIYPLKNKQ